HIPGALALPHERLECSACHASPWRPIERLVAEDQKLALLAMDQACIRCHEGLVHHNNEIAKEVPNCVSCHREHRGQHGLTKVADQLCAGCHGDLRTVGGPSTTFFRTITSFATHPDFGVLRRNEPDPGTIWFNHTKHLPPEGLLGTERKLVFLKCA